MVILEKHSNHQFIHSYKYLLTIHNTHAPTEYVVPFGIWNWRIFIALAFIWVFCMEPSESPGTFPSRQLFPADFSEVSTALGGHQSEVQIPHEIARISSLEIMPFLAPWVSYKLNNLKPELSDAFLLCEPLWIFQRCTQWYQYGPDLPLIKSDALKKLGLFWQPLFQCSMFLL